MSDQRNPDSPQPSYGEPIGQNREPDGYQQPSEEVSSEIPSYDSEEEE
ncbi:hypothetical protein [Sphingomicrobium sediminis]|uniref:Uncharacterized protein n=1 Tax=Sphingomicrobium sediminis TaxID=2950949 RepID=A0A9X2EH65_9SPHN|nr:hypothetical protein [Sphingomicrobium sediminis]MCM8557391.1 hypothetical protein [Sphingomicrobium sediminis]